MLRVGDRVVTTRVYDNLPAGSTGSVCSTELYPGLLGILLDKHFEFAHDCDHHCPPHSGWYVPVQWLSPEQLSPLETQIREYITRELI